MTASTITFSRNGLGQRPPALLQLATPAAAPRQPPLRVWLAAHRDDLFRWTLGRAGGSGPRRMLATTAVSIQRLRGRDGFDAWLFGAAVQAAVAAQALPGGLPEAALAGLAPELRTVLRLVSRRLLRAEEALALLPQRMDNVRNRLLRTRLAGCAWPGMNISVADVR